MDGLVNPVAIAGRAIGPGEPCFVIAEAGVNHNGDLEMARLLIDAAAAAGADAVKFQTFDADRLAAADAPKAAYQQETTGAQESQRDMLRRLQLSEADHRVLMDHARAAGILFLSSPFDEAAADLLHRLELPAFKIPSGEVTNPPFLRHVAAMGRPVILSTGMATLDEIAAAVACLDAVPLVLLHCISAYPTDPADCNLRAMATLETAFGRPTGWSDHTEGIAIPIAAAALGACVIEKHFTLDRSLPGPDHRASLEPDDLTAMVAGIRQAQSALGDGNKSPHASEADTARVARKSLHAARDLPAGTVLAAGDLVARRPGTGLSPARLPDVLGRRLARDLAAGAALSLDMVAP